MNSCLKKICENSTWMIAAKVINIIIGLVVSVSLTRYLGAEQKGEMANAQVISAFWGFIASFGVLDIMISKFSIEKDKSAEIAASGMALMFCGGIVAFLLSIYSAIILDVEIDVLIYVVLYAFVYIFQYLSIYEYWFYSNSNSKYYAVAQSVVHLIFLLFIPFGILLKLNLLYFIIVSVLETITTYMSLIVCYKNTKCYFVGKFTFNKQIAKELFKLALPMIAMGFATTIYMKVDQIMVGKIMGNSELGLYSVAVNLSEYWYFIPATIYSSFLPILTESYGYGEDLKKKLQQFADIMILIAYIAVLGVMIFGHWGIIFLYGEEFEGAANILKVYIWSGLFTCLSYSSQAFYIIYKDTKTIMWINLWGATINFALNIILIKILGSIGAAIATLLQYAIIAFGQMVALKNVYGELYEIQLRSLFPFFRLWNYYKGLTYKKRR